MSKYEMLYKRFEEYGCIILSDGIEIQKFRRYCKKHYNHNIKVENTAYHSTYKITKKEEVVR